MPRTMPVSDLQRNFKSVVDACEKSKEPIYLTRNGYPALVVMDATAYDEEQDLKQLLYEREMRVLRGVVEGHEQVERGESVSLNEARAMRDSKRGNREPSE